MNEQQLRRLFRRLVLLSAPVPLAVLGAACGGTMTHGSEETGGTSGTGDDGGSGGAVHQGGAGSGGTVVHQGGAGSGGTGVVIGTGGTGPLGGNGGAGAAGGFGGFGGNAISCQGNVQGGGCMPVLTTVARQCLTAEQAVPSQSLPRNTCTEVCGQSFPFCTVNAVEPASVSVMCNPGCAVGRRPAGLASSASCDSRAAGSYFAEIAHLEAASVTAFRVLRNELRAKGAPKKLVRAAGRAARDEIRHARATSALARRFGGAPKRPAIERRPVRSVEAMAIENAVEGCVRETFGALLATWQATQARDPVVRATMMRIARDETRHASLSWSVARFLDTLLEPAGRQRVEHARRGAARELLASLAHEPSPAFAEIAGLPSPAEAQMLATEMSRALWS